MLTVLVTGFGPFGSLDSNPSELIAGRLGSEFDDIRMVTHVFSVSYDDVQRELPKLLEQTRPSLTIHLGVCAWYKEIVVEVQSFNKGYCRKNIHGLVPLNNCCTEEDKSILSTAIDVVEVVERAKKDAFINSNTNISISTDPGRYLCGFVYYLSLLKQSCPTLFIHVPPAEKKSVDLVTEVLKKLVRIVLSTPPLDTVSAGQKE